ncbi:MAG: NADH-quinone oxidoreductase subunit NuoE [Alphaproteobacteria bacterium]
MSVRRLAVGVGPEVFEFTPENIEWAHKEVTKYPEGRQQSAVIALLDRAQRQSGGWLPEAAVRYVSDFLDMPYIKTYEVATFYTMFNLNPVGEHHIQLCGTTPCWLRGADDLKEVCRSKMGVDKEAGVSADGKFSWAEVECLGACVNAPMIQIGDDFYEDLTPETLAKLLDDLAAGREIKAGPQINRQLSAPEGGPKTLLELEGGDA